MTFDESTQEKTPANAEHLSSDDVEALKSMKGSPDAESAEKELKWISENGVEIALDDFRNIINSESIPNVKNREKMQDFLLHITEVFELHAGGNKGYLIKADNDKWYGIIASNGSIAEDMDNDIAKFKQHFINELKKG